VRICLIGKFPPIQGGVSMRTYWAAHALAARGHEVHVVTNAKEALPPFRMLMRQEDWRRCEASYGSGSVTVHWTDPVDRSQAYIPMASPFVSKLAALAARVHAERPFDVIFSFYLEPYGVAGYLVAQMTGAPHVVRTAGSDAGRLWRHPQLEALYDHVLRSAAVVITGRTVAARAIARGIDAGRIAFAGGVVVPEDLFVPDGPVLDLAALRAEVADAPDLRDLLWGDFAADRPYFGVYGKLGDRKGSFALLGALHRLKAAGLEVGLVALAHGTSAVQGHFRERAQELGLADRILQIPFLPHWRVPEFLRGCLAVCCLEQDFPIGFHSPITPREVLLCGKCLVAATEVIKKLPGYGQLPHGYGWVAIENVNDVGMLSERLAAIVRDPAPAADVGARGREFALELQGNIAFPRELEQALEAAVARRPIGLAAPEPTDTAASEAAGRFRLTKLAAAALGDANADAMTGDGTSASAPIPDLPWARRVLAAVEQRAAHGNKTLSPLAMAVRAEIAVVEAEEGADAAGPAEASDFLFRLQIGRWAMGNGDLAGLVCVCDPRLRLLAFDFDVSLLTSARTVEDVSIAIVPRRSHIVAFGQSKDGRREPLVVDELTARMLELSDGSRTSLQIVENLRREGRISGRSDGLRWIERLFAHGLLVLRDRGLDGTINDLPTDVGSPRDTRGGQGDPDPQESLSPLRQVGG
jgi:glycosyltransferase involved in cell wall biosynthesis